MEKKVKISVLLENIIPISTIQDKYLNNHKEQRYNCFIVGRREKTNIKVSSEDEIIIVGTLTFKDPKGPKFGFSLTEVAA